jgi:Uma2 family endonuclease
MAIQTLARESHIVLQTDWQGYLKMLEVVGDSKVRVTYDGGLLELMTTSRDHESVKSLLARLLEVLLEDRDTDFVTGGSPTFKRQALDKGLEPDDCYWIENYTEFLRQPPDAEELMSPDLALEVDVSRSVLNRLNIYAALRTREVWRWRKGHVQVYRLKPDNTYEVLSESPLVPGFPMSALREHLALRHSEPTSRILRRFRAWVRRNRQA